MNKRIEKTGRTIFDIISEYPKYSFFSFIVIILILFVFILNGNSFKIGNLEINPKNEIQNIKEKIPVNINTGNNNGVVGNNNTVNNIGEQPITLLDSDKLKLINLVDLQLDKLPKEKLRKIEILGTTGNKRSMELAELIRKFLNSKGYNVSGKVNSAMFFGNNLKGVKIVSNGKVVEISVFIV